ncbi:hypothetical protein DUNSADRAFT_7017 [Dunaliella salina]|uniref:Fe/B12 periplasmic-binding domain-containing protein n=1 Tax=Dunaliella salina TaxID=3046 RepID=A0ABQ7GM48_DUNSA|nr:hypothetical protein DUNSADRAFT_7017 [Dunaliella salina]|eukprot:KAF5835689.1 hypothetical protein DUNSADRAFT_7017 [Dunaliella salina]
MTAGGEMQQAQLQQLQHRVVSLLPSATEIVVQVGGSHLLCGRSHECDYPPEITHLPMLTSATNGHFTNSRDVHDSTTSSMVAGRGLYGIDGDQLVKIKPTVVVTQSLCSVCSIDLVTVERILRKAKFEPPPKIVILNPFSIEDVLHDMLSVGSAIGLEAQSKAAVEKLQARIQAASSLASKLAPAKHGKCAFLEWIDPLFCGGHWTPQLIAMAGGSHPLNPPSAPGQAAQPSGVISPEAVSAMDPDIVIISPCGLDLATAEEESTAALADQAWWRDLRAVREGRVVLVDGNAHFNRPGPRLVDALEFLVGLFNDMPECIPEGFPWKRLRMPEVRQQDMARAANANGASGAATSLTSASKSGVTASDDKSPEKSAAVDGNRNEAPAVVCGNGRGAAAALAPHLGPSCAPNLAHDVEEAHAAACGVGNRHYVDPVSGYMAPTWRMMWREPMQLRVMWAIGTLATLCLVTR